MSNQNNTTTQPREYPYPPPPYNMSGFTSLPLKEKIV